MKMTSDRVYGLDILKAICAFLVVTIHAPFQGVLGSFVAVLGKIAVPIFFMITGYFYSEARQRGKELRQIKKILWLCVLTNIAYFFWGLLMCIVKGEQLSQFLANAFSLKSMAKFLVLNASPFSEHLWYLGAILYVLVIVFFLYRTFPKSADTVLFAVTPLLLAANLLFGKYSFLFLRREYPYILVRNFLCVGIPYFSIGLFLRKYECIVSKFCKRRRNLIFLFLLLVCIVILKSSLLNYFNFSATIDHYFSTTILSVIVFVIFTNRFWNNKVSFLARIGQDCSTYIYIIHPMVINVLSVVMRHTPICGIYNLFRPIVVYALSVPISLVLNKIRIKKP